MEVTRIRALRGPNLWSRHTAIEAIVACRGNENAIEKLPGFEAALRARFPAIGELHPVVLGQPLSLAHVLENAALALQAQAGCQVTFSHTSPPWRTASTRWWCSTAKRPSAGSRPSWRAS